MVLKFFLSPLGKWCAASHWPQYFQMRNCYQSNWCSHISHASLPLTAFKIFVFSFLKFNYVVSWYGFLWEFSYLGFNQLLETVGVCFTKFGEFSAIISSNMGPCWYEMGLSVIDWIRYICIEILFGSLSSQAI